MRCPGPWSGFCMCDRISRALRRSLLRPSLLRLSLQARALLAGALLVRALQARSALPLPYPFGFTPAAWICPRSVTLAKDRGSCSRFKAGLMANAGFALIVAAYRYQVTAMPQIPAYPQNPAPTQTLPNTNLAQHKPRPKPCPKPDRGLGRGSLTKTVGLCVRFFVRQKDRNDIRHLFAL